MKILPYSFIFVALLTLVACGGAEEASQQTSAEETVPPRTETQAEIDENIIQEFVLSKDMEAESLPSGLYYEIVEAGGEAKPSLSSLVTVHYTGTTLDGTVFDSSKGGEPVRFPLAQLVKGWQEGIPLIGKGGKIQLVLPSELGYGSRSAGPNIAPNSVLVFDIELIDFE